MVFEDPFYGSLGFCRNCLGLLGGFDSLERRFSLGRGFELLPLGVREKKNTEAGKRGRTFLDTSGV